MKAVGWVCVVLWLMHGCLGTCLPHKIERDVGREVEKVRWAGSPEGATDR
jgi:hypothetical protein